MKEAFSHKGFSIIEVLVGIFIFSLGLVAIYGVLVSSLKVNDYNKNAIIASNLAREQIELIRNIRDTNYEVLSRWDRIDDDTYFEAGKYYKIESDTISGDTNMVDIDEISGFQVGEEFVTDSGMKQYQLCLSLRGEYIYCNGAPDSKKIPFYKYISVIQAQDENGDDIENAYQIESHVIWNIRGYHEYNIKTLLTDWRRI